MSTPRHYQWLLFDADGTLFDYDRAEAKALEGTFCDFNLPFNPDHANAYQKINHQIWIDFENGQITSEALRVVRFERLFETLNLEVDTERFSAGYLHNLAAASDLIAGAEPVIRTLSQTYRLAIITNGLKDVQRPRLARSAITGDFEVVAISEEIGVAKPDPRFFTWVFEHIGSPPKEQVLVIGDSLTSDIQGGFNYGLDTCWYNPGRKPAKPELRATYEISSLEALVPLLNSPL